MLTSSYLLEIATKAPKLFQSSKAALKSKLLRFLLSNLVIQDKKLVFNLKTPFDVIAECSKNQSWLRIPVMNPEEKIRLVLYFDCLIEMDCQQGYNLKESTV